MNYELYSIRTLELYELVVEGISTLRYIISSKRPIVSFWIQYKIVEEQLNKLERLMEYDLKK